jgi:hypothetical protein
MSKFKVEHSTKPSFEIEAADYSDALEIIVDMEGYKISKIEEAKNMIEAWALAIKKHEGYFPGSAAYRNNNPGNFRCSSLVMGEFGATSCVNNLAVFPTYEKGFSALKQFLIYACTGELRSYKPTMTLLDFYKVYAPSADNNNPLNYATAVATDLGVSVGTKIADLYISGTVDADDVPVEIENQLAYGDIRFGNTKLLISTYGCKFLCVKYMYERKIGKKISVKDLDAKLLAGNCYSGNSMLDDTAIARTLGFEFLGKEKDINKAPDWNPTIKEVDFANLAGQQQHFVIRDIEDGKRIIRDPYTGVVRKINYYELKCGTPNWEKGGFSYRKFKI